MKLRRKIDYFTNKTYQADCLEKMNELPDKSIDMILCDLPYGTTDCSWDIIIPFDLLWEQYKRIIKDNGAIVLFGNQPFTTKLISSNFEMFRYCIYWNKMQPTGFLNAGKQPLRCIEEICFFYNKQCLYKPIKTGNDFKKVKYSNKNLSSDCYGSAKNSAKNAKFTKYSYGNYPRNFLPIKRDNKKLHPTQKPLKLFQYLILTYTNENAIVLDNCAGSGTTAIACLSTKRKYILIEKEEKYIKVIENRIAHYYLDNFKLKGV